MNETLWIIFLIINILLFGFWSLLFSYAWATYKLFEQKSHTVWGNKQALRRFVNSATFLAVILVTSWLTNIPKATFNKIELSTMLIVLLPLQCICVYLFRTNKMTQNWGKVKEVPWKKLFQAYTLAILVLYNYVFIILNIARG